MIKEEFASEDGDSEDGAETYIESYRCQTPEDIEIINRISIVNENISPSDKENRFCDKTDKEMVVKNLLSVTSQSIADPDVVNRDHRYHHINNRIPIVNKNISTSGKENGFREKTDKKMAVKNLLSVTSQSTADPDVVNRDHRYHHIERRVLSRKKSTPSSRLTTYKTDKKVTVCNTVSVTSHSNADPDVVNRDHRYHHVKNRIPPVNKATSSSNKENMSCEKTDIEMDIDYSLPVASQTNADQDVVDRDHKYHMKDKRGSCLNKKKLVYKCFTCSKVTKSKKVNILQGASRSELGFRHQINKVIGGEVTIQKSDFLCLHCALLFNTMADLEKDLASVQQTLSNHLLTKSNIRFLNRRTKKAAERTN